jgi:hypothetical protein
VLHALRVVHRRTVCCTRPHRCTHGGSVTLQLAKRKSGSLRLRSRRHKMNTHLFKPQCLGVTGYDRAIDLTPLQTVCGTQERIMRTVLREAAGAANGKPETKPMPRANSRKPQSSSEGKAAARGCKPTAAPSVGASVELDRDALAHTDGTAHGRSAAAAAPACVCTPYNASPMSCERGPAATEIQTIHCDANGVSDGRCALRAVRRLRGHSRAVSPSPPGWGARRRCLCTLRLERRSIPRKAAAARRLRASHRAGRCL